MILTILRIMYLRLRNNPVELLLVFVMPVAFFSIFAAIFSNGITTGSEKKLRVGWIVQRQTSLGSQLKDFLEENSTLECLSLITEPGLTDAVPVGDSAAISDPVVDALIANAQRSGRYDLIVRLPTHFPEDISDDASREPCPIHLVTDGQNPMALAMVTSVINGFVAQKKAAWAAEQLINTGPLRQQSVGKSTFPSSELLPASSRNEPWVDVEQMYHQRWIEPLADPGQICLRGTRYLDPDRNPCSAFLIEFNKNGPLAKADSLSSTLEVLDYTPDSSKDRLFSSANELEQTVARAVRFRNSQYIPSNYLPNDWGQCCLEEDAPSDLSAKSVLVAASPNSVARRSSNASIAQLLETSQVTQPASGGRDLLEISVENPQSALQENPRIAMYAAGIAVLFLLFSSTGNAATLLEEAESGTLDRIMVGKAKVAHIIGGKWLGIFLLGMVQISVMFLWAEFVFQIQLWKHLDGFFVMTCCTSAATASLAMLMATLCRSRAQLNAISVVLILSMSAMGGSMIPRFVMSDRMKEIGQWTFNAWALDGYQKVFWYQAPMASLMTEVTVLLGSALVMGCLALIFSQRWKRA